MISTVSESLFLSYLSLIKTKPVIKNKFLLEKKIVFRN